MPPVTKRPPSSPEPTVRHGRGIPGFHKRLVRRARMLLGDPEFRDAIRDARTTWNRDYAEYTITPGDILTPETPPADRVCLATTPEGGLPQRLAADAQRWLDDPSSADAFGREFWAEVAWGLMVQDLVDHFWPHEDFSVPSDGEHPVCPFIRVCLVTDPAMLRALDPDSFIRRPRLVVVSLPQPINGAKWCIPIHAGMTADDLRQVADRLACEAEAAYGRVDPAARVYALHDNGSSKRGIARRLGLTDPTVRNILATR